MFASATPPFPKSGKASVGVARQWCGRLGKIDNCQVGIFMAYVSRHEHALGDTRLYLPGESGSESKYVTELGIRQFERDSKGDGS